MSAPTINERCAAQERACIVLFYESPLHLLTADELRAALTELAALRAALDLTTDRLVFYMQNIPIAYKDYIKTNEGEISYSIVNSSLSLLKKEATL